MNSYENIAIEQKVYSGINDDGVDSWCMKINGLKNKKDIINLVIVELAGFPMDDAMLTTIKYRSHHYKKLPNIKELIEEATAILEVAVSEYVQKERSK